jgi:uracil-DNA glycosylase family 4
MADCFNINCRQCPRLAAYLDDVRQQHAGYHAAPVSPFGARDPGLLVVGLAPGLHGANATGRPFTGDHAGIILYETLYKFGFSTRPESKAADDDLKLINCRITNAVKCVPPANKPIGEEISRCNSYLACELEKLRKDCIVLALGRIAHQAVVRALGSRQSAYPFSHGAVHHINGLALYDSYHCSRYNTQTRRLTTPMFHRIFRKIRKQMP